MRTPLRRKAASQYLLERHGIERAPATLAKIAVTGGGPPFSHAGRIPLYAPDDLDQWALSLIRGPVCSTSERATKAPTVVEPVDSTPRPESGSVVETGLAGLAKLAAAAAKLPP
jgi:hypothetical protein